MGKLKTDEGISYWRQCLTSQVAYSSFLRWKRRRDRGEEILRRPGPKMVAPLDLENLEEEIQALAHCRKRTHGTGNLYRQYKDEISRRSFQGMVKKARRETNRERRAGISIVCWKKPGYVWAMDDSEYGKDTNGMPVHLHNVQDLGSRYKFPPLAGGALPCGETVADHLERLFTQYGPPLFLKRDNGGNLNQSSVNGLLSETIVIPLNNPPYYAPYNGGMERAQREIKCAIRQKTSLVLPDPIERVYAWAESAAHMLNHKPRQCLDGRTPCQVFQTAPRELRVYNRRKRREIYDEIKAMAVKILEQIPETGSKAVAKAWRIAVQSWLQCNGVISITRQKKVLPLFPKKISHN